MDPAEPTRPKLQQVTSMKPAADNITSPDGQGKESMADTSSKEVESSKTNIEPSKTLNNVVVPKKLNMLQVIKCNECEDDLVTEGI